MYDIMQLTQQVYHNLSSFRSVGCIIHEVVRTLCASMDKTIWPLGDRREVQPSKGSRMKAPQGDQPRSEQWLGECLRIETRPPNTSCLISILTFHFTCQGSAVPGGYITVVVYKGYIPTYVGVVPLDRGCGYTRNLKTAPEPRSLRSSNTKTVVPGGICPTTSVRRDSPGIRGS